MEDHLLSVDTEWGMLLHVIIASALAGIVGIEREFSNKPAGFRTHIIIGGAAALLIMLGRVLIRSYSDLAALHIISSDPLRIVQAIIVGVSFIGAGTILKLQSKHAVRFLTTAATTLLSAAIGVAIALQLYYLAVGVAVFTVVVNFLLGRLDTYISAKMHIDEDEY